MHAGCALLAVAVFMTADTLDAQDAANSDLQSKVQTLTEALAHAQDQIESSQREIADLRRQLADIQKQMDAAGEQNAATAQQRLSAEVEALKEQQSLQGSQIATHDQEKAETTSKYPLKLTGLVLFSGLVNTSQVDQPSAPSLALSGDGSTAFSLRQTVLGFDARGPHILGARSYADARVDFFGQMTGVYSPGSGSAGLLRLRTAHAALAWEHAEAAFSLDRPILSPNIPTSLTAVAVPALAWSGNLWTWNPQIVASGDIPLSSAMSFRAQAALIDVADPDFAGSPISYIQTPSAAEQSRWPGAEAHFAFAGPPSHGQNDTGFQIGAGGYFSPHRTLNDEQFDAWAGTLDYRQPLPDRLQFSGSFYRGQALGGLGGGAFKDYGVHESLLNPLLYYVRPLDAVGGWAELKERASERLEFNAAFGTDSGPASEVRRYPGPVPDLYQYLSRTQTWTGNVIYSPSAWLLFSLEYRHLQSTNADGTGAGANIAGVAAGYKF